MSDPMRSMNKRQCRGSRSSEKITSVWFCSHHNLIHFSICFFPIATQHIIALCLLPPRHHPHFTSLPCPCCRLVTPINILKNNFFSKSFKHSNEKCTLINDCTLSYLVISYMEGCETGWMWKSINSRPPIIENYLLLPRKTSKTS